jgi:hypothetical protein
VSRQVGYDDLGSLCRGIERSFVHLETRDAYGTETEQPHIAKWRRGEPDDDTWLASWMEMLRGHRAAGRTCRRAQVVSEPLSEYQRWVDSFVDRIIAAGEDIRRVARPRLTSVLLPGSGDFYVFDDRLVVFLHYAGVGTNTAFELTEAPGTVATCRDAFEAVWELTTPSREYRPDQLRRAGA